MIHRVYISMGYVYGMPYIGDNVLYVYLELHMQIFITYKCILN